MPIAPLSFGLQSNPGEWGADGTNRLINAYAEDMGDEGKVRFPLRASPGLKPFGTAPVALPIRGTMPVGGLLYTVSGQALFPVDTTGMFGSDIGGIPGTAPVFMAINQRKPHPEVAIVVDGNRFILLANPTAPVLTSIADVDLPPPIAVIYVDGYFLYAIEDGRVFVSGINDGGNINALAFFTAEGQPDGLVSMGVRAREVFLFGQTSIEVWENDGRNIPAPFSRSLGTFIEHGCIARNSVTNFAETLAWIDDEGIVRLASGYTPTRISNHAVERAIEDLTDTERAAISGLTYTVAGHRFLQLSSAQWSWDFNERTGLWNERQSYLLSRSRGAVSTVFNGKQIIGDFENGQLYELDRKTFDEAGNALIWTIRAPIQHAYPSKLKFSAFYADLIPGVGLNETDPALKDPKAMLRYSDDGGHTWSNTRELAVGKIGEKGKRIRANNLGKTGEDGRTWELSVSAAVARGLTGAAANVGQRMA